jgi:hypothetical protein
MGDGEDQYHKNKFIPGNSNSISNHAPPLNNSSEFDAEYESVITTGGKIVKWGLVGIVTLAAAGVIFHSCSSRAPENSSSRQSYIVPANYTTTKLHL